nr:Cytidine and deoxycytidylate deaminase zinc-binding region [uncultured bacterium]
MPSTNSAANKAIVAYVPALHAGYLTFFRNHPGAHIYVLGWDFINAFPRLNRDLRALAPDEAALALTSLGFEADVLADPAIVSAYETIVLPDEDVSRDFAQKHLAGKSTALESVFLRWDAVAANKPRPHNPDRTTTTEVLHQELMGKAVKEAQKSPDWWRQIGAVLVKDGALVARAHTYHAPSDLVFDILGTPRITVDFGERPDLYISMHAEAGLVARAAHEGVALKGASIYTSTFPCINCAYLIAQSGIGTLYYLDEYSNLNAEEILKNAGVEVVRVEVA